MSAATIPAPAAPAAEFAPARAIGGVCAELARRLNASVGFIRVVAAIAIFLTQKWGFYAYLAAVLFLPQNGRRLPGAANIVGLLRVGMVWLLITLTFGNVSTGGLFDQSPAVWITYAGICLAGLLGLLASGLWEAEAAPRSDSSDGPLALASVAVLAVAGTLVAGMAVAPGVRWERIVPGAVAILGAVLVARGRRGDGRALLLPAVFAAGGVLLLGASGARLQGGVGGLDVRPTSAPALRSSYRRAIGDLTVDLTNLRARGQALRLSLSVGIGNLQVVLPQEASAVTIDARLGRGTLIGPIGRVTEGFGVRRRLDGISSAWGAQPRSALPRPTQRLFIDAAIGLGTILIDVPPEQGP
jgi:phage shock protein PspC (stress-responsive transcriptional regulator)